MQELQSSKFLQHRAGLRVFVREYNEDETVILFDINDLQIWLGRFVIYF